MKDGCYENRLARNVVAKWGSC